MISLQPDVGEASASATCDIAEVRSTRELHEFLGRRAVAVVARASRATWETDPQLARLVTSSAPFNLGSGDVGRPIGAGVVGARALAKAIGADTFRFLGWDYMDGLAQPCAKQQVKVEFIDSRSKRLSSVEFTFEAGRLVAAAGWMRSFESGGMSPVAGND